MGDLDGVLASEEGPVDQPLYLKVILLLAPHLDILHIFKFHRPSALIRLRDTLRDHRPGGPPRGILGHRDRFRIRRGHAPRKTVHNAASAMILSFMNRCSCSCDFSTWNLNPSVRQPGGVTSLNHPPPPAFNQNHLTFFDKGVIHR